MNVGFEQFIKERQYLTNVTPRTVEWYRQSFKCLTTETPSQSDLNEFVIRMRERGLKATSCNNRIRAVNAYLRWMGSGLKVQRLKEEQRVLPTFAKSDIARVVGYKPKTFGQHRVKMIFLTLADTGCRISEVLQLRWSEIDMDNMLFTVHGKGRKKRKVPFSYQLRRFLFRYQQQAMPYPLVFATKTGCRLGKREVYRDTKNMCVKLGIVVPERMIHALRHTFAVNYLRSGGSVFHLQQVLGHSSLEMTRRYCSLLTEDLQQMQQKTSPLDRFRSNSTKPNRNFHRWIWEP